MSRRRDRAPGHSSDRTPASSTDEHMPIDQAQTALEDFLDEAADQLDRIDSELLDVAYATPDQAALDTILRGFHTIKGTAACLGLSRIAALTHTGETLVSQVREGTRAINGEWLHAVLDLVDTLQALLGLVPSGRAAEPAVRLLDRPASSTTKGSAQPITRILNSLPSLGEDLAARLGKRVRVEMHGLETTVAPRLLGALRTVLVQLVRNAVDHGLELPEIRRMRGKRPEGLVQVDVSQCEQSLVIRIADDGAGVNPDRVRNAALERKVGTAEQVAGLSKRQIQELIFRPGLSTAASVTALSGRGVGMDVARSRIEELGGHITLQSDIDVGTVITITIPTEQGKC